MATTWTNYDGSANSGNPVIAHNRGGTGRVANAGTVRYGDLDETESVKIQRKFLAIAKRNLVFARFAQKESKEKNSGLEVRWKRFDKLSLPLVPLAEGYKPPADTLTQSIIKLKLNQFGSYIATTDVLVAAAEDPIISTIIDRQGIQAAELIDYLTFLHMRTGTQATYASAETSPSRANVNLNIGLNLGVNAADAANKVYRTDLLDAAIRTLEYNEARKIAKQMTPSPDYGTEPVPEAYVAVCHTDFRKDLEMMPGYIPYQKYANNGMQMLPGERGAIGAIRFVLTTQASAFGQDPDGTHRVSTDISATQAGGYSAGWVDTEVSFGDTAGTTNATFGRAGDTDGSAEAGFDVSTGSTALGNNYIDDDATATKAKLETRLAADDDEAKTRIKVYPVLIFAEDAMGCVSLSGYDAVVPKVVMPAPAVTDPLGQTGSVGWKTWYACRVLNEDWLYRIECGVSSLT